MADETYSLDYWPIAFILSWQMSYGQVSANTFDGGLQFLTKNLAWNSFCGKLSRMTLVVICLDKN